MEHIDIDKLKFHEKSWSIIEGHKRSDIVVLQIYGKISCGRFKFIDNNIVGFVEIPKTMIGDGDYFILKATGDSMINAGINDGDLLIIQKQYSPEDGQIAVVMINEEEVTLKRFYRLEDKKKYLLHPENPNFDDIVVDHCEVLGIAKKIIKNLF